MFRDSSEIKVPIAQVVGSAAVHGFSAFPDALSGPSAPMSVGINEPGTREFLGKHGWPRGLQDTFLRVLPRCPIRYMIVDDSGSMAANDGKRLVGSGRNKKMVQSSRWTELTDAIRFHASLAEVACAPTEFRLLNASTPLVLGQGGDDDAVNYQRLNDLLGNAPSGGTPLCRHISEIVAQIRGMERSLRANGHKAVIVIATDGESSDGDVAAALRPLQTMPVLVVIRLCTDDDRIVDYWNSIDEQLELEIDVLDDYASEAAEVMKVNNWFTYGEPLHRMREFGLPLKELDLIDEAKLSADQMRSALAIILGGRPDDYPHPSVDWKAFSNVVNAKLKEEPELWCPVHNRMRKAVSLRRLGVNYANKVGCSIM